MWRCRVSRVRVESDLRVAAVEPRRGGRVRADVVSPHGRRDHIDFFHDDGRSALQNVGVLRRWMTDGTLVSYIRRPDGTGSLLDERLAFEAAFGTSDHA
jgi:hypothetical protein